MDALISAQAGTALLIQGSALVSIHASAPELAIPRRADEVHLLFGEAADLEVLESVDRDEVIRRLTREVAATEALQLFLILLDTDMPEEIRREAAEELDSALADSECREGLERVLYAHPLPATAELPNALAYAEGPAPRVQNLLRQLGDLQPTIAEVRRAWISLPDTLFASPANRQRFQVRLVRAGLFRKRVLARYTGSSVGPKRVREQHPATSRRSLGTDREPTAGNPRELAESRFVFRDRAQPASALRPRLLDTLSHRRVATVPATIHHDDMDLGLVVPEIQQGIHVERNFERLYNHFHPRLLRHFIWRGVPDAEAEDLCQEVLFRAFHSLGSFRFDSQFERWLFEIAHNLYVNQMRQSAAEKRAGVEVLLQDAEDVARAPVLPASGPSPYDEVLRREETAKLRAALETLPPQVRHCFYLRVYQGLKYREVAEVMNISLDTVKEHLGQAKVLLRQLVSSDEKTKKRK